jgi:hypothetical protein
MAAKQGHFNVWIILLIAGGVGVVVCFVACGSGAALLYVRHERAEQQRTEACLNRISILDDAVECYRIKHGQYPPDLDALFDPGPDGSPPLLDDRNLLNDPWGDPIYYDPAGNMNYGARPDIWVDRHDQSIGNWDLPHPAK